MTVNEYISIFIAENFCETTKHHFVKLIARLPDDETKIRYLTMLGSCNGRDSIIASFSSDEAKLKILAELKLDDNSKGRVIASLNDETEKLKFLRASNTNGGQHRFRIIASLSNDELKLEFLYSLDSEYSKAIVISSLSSDEKSLNC